MSNLITRNGKPNVIRGGIARQFAPGLFYMNGRTHAAGGIDIGKNPRTGVEVEDGEVVQLNKNGMRVFSAMPFLTGESPANLVANGADPDIVFAAQENFKDRFGINDDGTMKAEYGLKVSTRGDDDNKYMTFKRMINTLGKLYYDAKVKAAKKDNVDEETISYYPSLETVQYIKNKEAFRPNIYRDGKGVPTIGYGTTQSTKAGKNAFKLYGKTGMTEEQASSVFNETVREMLPTFISATPNFNKLNDNQRNALFSYYYNVGHGGYTRKSPKLQQALKDFNLDEVVNQMDFGYYDTKNSGLRKRRDEERALFNMKSMGGIHIDKNKRGTFTAAATKHGMGVQEFASRVLANKEDYSPAMVKKANFARNASKWKKPLGGIISINGNVKNGLLYTDRPKARIGINLEDAEKNRGARYAGERPSMIGRVYRALTEPYNGNPYMSIGYAPIVGTRINPKSVQQYLSRLNRLITRGNITTKEVESLTKLAQEADLAEKSRNINLIEKVGKRPFSRIKTLTGDKYIEETPNLPVLSNKRGFTMPNRNAAKLLRNIGIGAGTAAAIGGAGTTGYLLGNNNAEVKDLNQYVEPTKLIISNYNKQKDIDDFVNKLNKISENIYDNSKNNASVVDRTIGDISPLKDNETPFVQDRIILTPDVKKFNIPEYKVKLKKVGGEIGRKKALTGIYIDENGNYVDENGNWIKGNLFNNRLGWIQLGNAIKNNKANILNPIGISGERLNVLKNNTPVRDTTNRQSQPAVDTPVWDDIFNETVIGERPAVSPRTGRLSDNYSLTIPDRIIRGGEITPPDYRGDITNRFIDGDFDGEVSKDRFDKEHEGDTTGGGFNLKDPAIIGAGINMLGTLGSYLINRNILNKARPRPTNVRLTAQKLKTRYNINPQLDELREQAAANNRLINNNTASSRVNVGRQALINTNLARDIAKLYGIKEDKETELINQDTLNSQGVRNQESIYNAQLDQNYKNASNEHNMLRLVSKSALFSGLTGGFNSIADSLLRQRYYNNTIGAIAARNPNVDARIFRDAGVDWSFMHPYSTRNR